jgi:hypothetical protein
MWVKVNLCVQMSKWGLPANAESDSLDATLEMKIERTMKGGEFKNILQKLLLMIWNEHIKETTKGTKNNVPNPVGKIQQMLNEDQFGRDEWEFAQSIYILTEMSVKAPQIRSMVN